MTKGYELTLIVSSQLAEGAVDETVKRFEGFLTEHEANVVNVNRLGVRKLAYEVAKQQQADYTFVQFEADSGILPELDRICKLDEAVLRHLIVLVEDGFEVAEAEAEAKADRDEDKSEDEDEDGEENEEDEDEDEDEEDDA